MASEQIILTMAKTFEKFRYQDSTMSIGGPWHSILRISDTGIQASCGFVYKGVELQNLKFANGSFGNAECELCEEVILAFHG